MDDKQRKEEQKKLKELRRELEDKIKDIIPDALKSQMAKEIPDEKIEESIVLDDKTAKQVIESLLFASSKPMMLNELSRIIKQRKPSQIAALINELREEYIATGRSFRINEVAQGYEISTLPQFSTWLMKLEKDKKAKQASLAALETLAILAYKQPITRVEIEEIRGVDASGVIATLMDRGFIRIVGRKEVPGRPLMYGTTEMFLEHFGLKSLEDLPDIAEIKALVEDTIKKEELLRTETIVQNTEANDAQQPVTTIPEDGDTRTLAEKYEEISKQIDEVKVISTTKLSTLLNPGEKTENAQEQHEPVQQP